MFLAVYNWLTMRFKFLLILVFLFMFLGLVAQESKMKKFKHLSAPEKCWVILHPFVAKKALLITEEARKVTKDIKQEKLLKGNGNSGQIDAFRHTYWMALLTQQIGWRRAKSLGKAHEKGNYRDFKKHKKEDGVVPDKISSDMDFFNNNVGILIGKMTTDLDLKGVVVEAVKDGKCKIIKIDTNGFFLDVEGNIIPKEELKGKWENDKCLVNSNQ